MRLRKLIGEIGAKYDRLLPKSSEAHRLLGKAEAEFKQWIPAGYLVAASDGMGQPVITPRIAILNPGETKTIRRGVYVAYLFAAGKNTVTLTLNQGIGEMADHLGRAGARLVLALEAATIRKALRAEDIADLDVTFDAHITAGLLGDYKHANIVSRTYRLDSLPGEQEMVADLQRFIRLYDLAVQARGAATRPPAAAISAAIAPTTAAAISASAPAAVAASTAAAVGASTAASTAAGKPPGPKVKPPSKPEAKALSKALSKAASGKAAEPEPELKPELKPEPKPEPKAPSKPAAGKAASAARKAAELEPEPKPEPKPEVEPLSKPEVKAPSKPEAGKAVEPDPAKKPAGPDDKMHLPPADTPSTEPEPEITLDRKHKALTPSMTRRGLLAALVAAPIAYVTPKAVAASRNQGATTQAAGPELITLAAPVFTIDVSQHDWRRRGGNLDWVDIRQAGIAGMCARATYGDPSGYNWPTHHFGDFARAAKDAGMGLRGGYHNLVRGDQASINRQVDWLRREMDKHDANWAMLDVERYAELVKADMWPGWEDVRRFDDRWAEVEDRVLVGYIPPWNWSKHLGQPNLREFRGPLIASNYPRNANDDYKELYERIGGNDGRGWETYGGRIPEGWQYTARAKVPGASYLCDVNAWRTTYQQLKGLLLGTR